MGARPTCWALTGCKVMIGLPNPVTFAAASATVRVEDLKALFACGPDVSRYVEVTQPDVDAGFDHLVLANAAPTRSASLPSSAASCQTQYGV